MTKKKFLYIFLLLLIFNSLYAKSPQKPYWVFFSDKGKIPSKEWKNCKKVILRKNFKIDITDIPIFKPYIDSLTARNIKIKNKSKWLNAVSIRCSKTTIKTLGNLSFIDSIRPVTTYKKIIPKTTQQKSGKILKNDFYSSYGYTYLPYNLINIPFMHDYISQSRKTPGENITIAVFDDGFYLDHPCFKRMLDSSMLISDSDFVDNDNDTRPMYINGGSHGASTLSLLAGYTEDSLIGTAYNAKYILARTEDGLTESHTEEDNWVSAMEWAYSLGADIISSSLGYRYGFTDGSDYTSEDMDGNTAIISKAATIGVSKGLIIVTAMGNEGEKSDSINLGAPADVEGVISVGATYNTGEYWSVSSQGPNANGIIKPDVVAPGTNIYCASTDNSYNALSGTSFATPLVAGCVALIKQFHPNLTPNELQTLLHTTSSKSSSPNNSYGWGIINPIATILDSFSVFGGIFDSATGSPIENATVILKETQDTCFSGKSGLYFFKNIPYKNIKIEIEKSGWSNISKNITVINFPAKRHDIFLKGMFDSTIIWGEVINTKKQFLGDVNIHYTGEISGNTKTLTNGSFYISDLKKGSYSVTLEKNGYQTVTTTFNVPLYSTLLCTLTSNEFSGIIKDINNNPIKDVIISCNDIKHIETLTDSSGLFCISPLSVGKHQLTFKKNGYKTIYDSIEIPIDSTKHYFMEPILFDNLSVYPIPVKNGKLYFEFMSGDDYSEEMFKTLEIAMYTIDGHRVKTFKKNRITNNNVIYINIDGLNNFSAGIYYLYVKFGNKVKRYKIPIIRP